MRSCWGTGHGVTRRVSRRVQLGDGNAETNDNIRLGMTAAKGESMRFGEEGALKVEEKRE